MEQYDWIDPKKTIYIYPDSEKGDCSFCDGVLVRSKVAEKEFEVNEGYICDRCGRVFVEGYQLLDKKPWQKSIKRRLFAHIPDFSYPFYRRRF